VRRGGVVCVIGVGKSVMNNLPFMHISLAEVSRVASYLLFSIHMHVGDELDHLTDLGTPCRSTSAS